MVLVRYCTLRRSSVSLMLLNALVNCTYIQFIPWIDGSRCSVLSVNVDYIVSVLVADVAMFVGSTPMQGAQCCTPNCLPDAVTIRASRMSTHTFETKIGDNCEL